MTAGASKLFTICLQNAHLVPFVENENEVFLKTIIPSRKATQEYLEHGASND